MSKFDEELRRRILQKSRTWRGSPFSVTVVVRTHDEEKRLKRLLDQYPDLRVVKKPLVEPRTPSRRGRRTGS